MRKSLRFGLLAIVAGAVAAGCSAAMDGTPKARLQILSAEGKDPSSEASPEGRLLIGRGKDYVPIQADSQQLFDRLEASMVERRRVAWKIVEDMLEPQPLTVNGVTYQVPLWLTWYEGAQSDVSEANNEVGVKIRLYFHELALCRADPNCRKTNEELAREVVADSTNKNLVRTLRTDNFEQRLRQFDDGAAPVAGHVGQGFTLFSPSFVEHVLAQAKGIEQCLEPANAKRAEAPPRSPTQFSHCIDEFPRSAVMVKTEWIEFDQGGRDNDTSAGAMRTLLGQNDRAWPMPRTVPLNERNIYSVRATDGSTYALRSIHFSTKDTREWTWISLWWSPRPNEDFGADRPASLARYNDRVWSNYKMCVTTAFEEKDPAPWRAFETSHPTLAAALKSTHEALAAQTEAAPYDRVTSWCSNPNIENHINNQKTNCIGCHQFSGAVNQNTALQRDQNGPTLFFDTLQLVRGGGPPVPAEFRRAYAANYPQMGRARIRKNFPADFAWSTLHEFPGQIQRAREANGIEW